MSIVSQVADAVAGELAAGQFSVPFKVIRAFRHEQTLPEGKELRVSVVPKGVTVTPASRGVCAHNIEIFVAVMKKVDRADPETVDPLLGLVEEIVDFFRLRRLEKFPEAAWTGTEVKPMVSTEHLEQLKQFTSLITLSLKLCR
jgi:hypothetical protein